MGKANVYGPIPVPTPPIIFEPRTPARAIRDTIDDDDGNYYDNFVDGRGY